MGILSRMEAKSSGPDWGVLERYLGWAFGGGVSSSGIVVNPQTALQSAAVFSCVKVLAESVGMLPFNLYREDEKGARTMATDHPLFEILHHQPNEFQTAVEFWEMLVMSLCMRGNGYAYVNRASSGRVVELLPVHPDMMRVEMSADYRLTYQVTMPDGSFKQMRPGEIFHVRGQTINGWLGISPIAYAREAIGLALATEKFGGQLFRNGAKMGGTLEHPTKLSQEAYDRLKNSFDAAHSGENAHRTAILEEGLKFNRISMNADDAQFLETRKYQRSEIAGIFRVPAHMINDLEGATFSNIEQQSIDFINKALMPWLRRIEQATRRDLFSGQDKKTLHCRFNVAALMRGDQQARSMYYHNGILDGWMTRNEPRHMESDIGIILNPIEGLDTPLMPLNMTDGSGDPDAADDAAEVAKSARIDRLELEMKTRPAPPPQVNITLNQEPVSVKIAPAAVTMNAPQVKSEPALAPNVQVDVHVPPAPAPVVHNTVNVPPQPAPVVSNEIHVPPQPAPNVTLEAVLPPLQITASIPPRKRVSETTIERDASGNIIKSKAVSTEQDV